MTTVTLTMEPTMTRKRIFVLNGHPAETSLTGALAAAYVEAARAAGHDPVRETPGLA